MSGLCLLGHRERALILRLCLVKLRSQFQQLSFVLGALGLACLLDILTYTLHGLSDGVFLLGRLLHRSLVLAPCLLLLADLFFDAPLLLAFSFAKLLGGGRPPELFESQG